MNSYRKLVMLFSVLILFLAACGQTDNEENSQGSGEINLEPLEVELILPEEGDPGTEITIETLVTQGEERVNDASEVIFEIWVSGEKEDSEFVDAEITEEDGVYAITYEFTEEAIYSVQPHVTARGMHMMPTGEIKVGDVPEEGEEQSHESEEEHSHHHGNQLHMEWQSEEEVVEGEETEITIYVELDEEPWTDGDVRFEIWQHGDEMRDWVDADETDSGVYTAFYTFEGKEDYHIMVHMEDEDHHDHIKQVIKINTETN
ncbi:FixH family protein [Evansella sp. LMS18]|uniref:FixH family protein n=1 Tax=Evansella sp. LMS18 TaxID=2924033 RepID=UPI0020D0CA70|nr:FixH family protein [Evansella sp. LMS18]UTR09030.1 FixH family protein [Evansella sp. LMS18]